MDKTYRTHLDHPLFFAGLPARVGVSFREHEWFTWRTLTSLSSYALLRCNGLGKEAFRRLTDAIERRGSFLSDDIAPWPTDQIAALASANAGVYFVHCQGFVKIGHASDIRKRLETMRLAVPFPMDLLAVVPEADPGAAGRIERSFHQRFGPLRVRGEWFSVAPELEHCIHALLTPTREVAA